ncbi:hypothetical protein BD413DRAFT_666040 [Trametes elegans]|nr:hypothetical protein BD413DRAFT_666040 [Trametes elegans]
MTTRYHLRSRADSTPVEATTHPGESSPLSSPTDNIVSSLLASPGSPIPPTADSHSASERRPGVLYSQVVTSRSPSPTASVAGEAASAAQTSPAVDETAATVVSNRKHRVIIEDVTDAEDDGPWTEVRRRRRARSASALPETRTTASARSGPALTVQQKATVKTAEAGMSAVDRERVRRRMEVVSDGRRRDMSQDSRGEGPSRDKGKSIDARNWGAVDIPHAELNPDAQRRELEMYSVQQSLNRNILDGYGSDEQREMLEYWKQSRLHPSSEPGNISRSPSPAPAPRARAEQADGPLARELAALRREVADLRNNPRDRLEPAARQAKRARIRVGGSPAEHLVTSVLGEEDTQKSIGSHRGYLGRAFDGLAGGEPSDSSGSSSSSSDASDDDADSLPRPGGRSSSSGDSGAHKRKHTKKPVLRPEKPEPYDGRADAQVFHKFMRQMTEREMHASTVSNFLTARAYRFFVTTVSDDPHRWCLRDLFVALFNYCFPVDYRLQMQERLRKCYQRDQTVRDYVHELESLFLAVDKLWNGLNVSIQKELWGEVQEAAELIEIAEQVGQRLGRHGGPAKQQGPKHPRGKLIVTKVVALLGKTILQMEGVRELPSWACNT